MHTKLFLKQLFSMIVIIMMTIRILTSWFAAVFSIAIIFIKLFIWGAKIYHLFVFIFTSTIWTPSFSYSIITSRSIFRLIFIFYNVLMIIMSLMFIMIIMIMIMVMMIMIVIVTSTTSIIRIFSSKFLI